MKLTAYSPASVLLCFVLSAAAPAIAQPGNTLACFQQASHYHRVDTGVLRAISIKENSRCDETISQNTNLSSDFGCMQINSVHFAELSKHGVYPSDLLHQCKNIFIGAWHYRKKINKYGNTWSAVGAYHSETPEKRDAYAKAVYKIWIARGLDM